MSSRPVIAVVAAIVVAGLLWYVWPGATEEKSGSSNQRAVSEASKVSASTPSVSNRNSIVSELVEAFRSNFPHSGNPVGDNVEITASLAGGNSLAVALIPRDHPAINERGELCDRWSTPFFFHQVSGTQMEIRSAGPDRILRTADDIVLEP